MFAFDKVDTVMLYMGAHTSAWNAICSIDDEETSDLYIKNRVYSAVYDATELLLTIHSVSVPDALADRIVCVRRFCPSEIVPIMCDKLVNGSNLTRADYGNIAVTVDYWLSQIRQKHEAVLGDANVQRQAMKFVC